MAADPPYTASARIAQKTSLPTVTLLLRVTQPLPSNGCFSGSTVLALSKYVTILCCYRILIAVINEFSPSIPPSVYW
jgi:hypothetical protein